MHDPDWERARARIEALERRINARRLKQDEERAATARESQRIQHHWPSRAEPVARERRAARRFLAALWATIKGDKNENHHYR